MNICNFPADSMDIVKAIVYKCTEIFNKGKKGIRFLLTLIGEDTESSAHFSNFAALETFQYDYRGFDLNTCAELWWNTFLITLKLES